MQKRTIGKLEILASCICFGFLGIFGKQVYAQGLTPGELLSFRFLGAALTIGSFLYFRSPGLFRLPLVSIFHCALLGILGYAIFSSCFFHALTGLSASLTVLLLYTYPIFVTLGAWVFFGEHISRTGWIALPLACIGLVALVAGDFRVENSWALLAGFASAVFYSVYILAARVWLKNINAFVAIFYIQAAAAFVLSAIHLHDFEHIIHQLTVAWLPLLGIIVISTVLAMGFFLAGLAKLSSSEASILSTAEPITGLILANFILGDRLSILQLTGAVLVIGALILILRAPSPN